MDSKKLLRIIAQVAQVITDACETEEDVKRVWEGVEKYIDLEKSISQR